MTAFVVGVLVAFAVTVALYIASAWHARDRGDE